MKLQYKWPTILHLYLICIVGKNLQILKFAETKVFFKIFRKFIIRFYHFHLSIVFSWLDVSLFQYAILRKKDAKQKLSRRKCKKRNKKGNI